LGPVRRRRVRRAPRGLERVEELCSGPGKLTQALGIELTHNGGDLRDGAVTISAGARRLEGVRSPRLGVTRAGGLPDAPPVGAATPPPEVMRGGGVAGVVVGGVAVAGIVLPPPLVTVEDGVV